jgi:hypothetical protein
MTPEEREKFHENFHGGFGGLRDSEKPAHVEESGKNE